MIKTLYKTTVFLTICSFSFLIIACEVNSKKTDKKAHENLHKLSEDKQEEKMLTVLDLEKLTTVKTAIENNSKEFKNAYISLIDKANDALSKAPFSVVNKTQTPPSGDKRDYLSIGIYWWPDPEKTDGLPWIWRDGQVNPITAGNNLDLNRKNSMFENTYSLGLAHFFSRDDKYAEKAIELLQVWFLNPETRMNPNLNYAQGIPGITEGRGIGIIEFIGITKIITVIELLELTNSIDKTTSDGLRLWFKDYLYWLQHSKNGIDERNAKNNHGTWYDVEVVSILMFLNRTEEAKKVLESVKANRIATQIEKDGKLPLELKRTRTLHYSIYNLQAFTYLAYFGNKVTIDLWNYNSPITGGIKGAYHFLYPYATGDKVWSYPEISDRNNVNNELSELFYVAGSLFNINEYIAIDKAYKEKKGLSVLTYSF